MNQEHIRIADTDSLSPLQSRIFYKDTEYFRIDKIKYLGYCLFTVWPQCDGGGPFEPPPLFIMF